MALIDVQIDSNSSGNSGGGIYATDASLNLKNVNIFDNSASNNGGSFFFQL